MPQVKSQITINAPFETVWNLAQNVESFPKIMPDLDGVEILEESSPAPDVKRTVTKWNGRIKQFNRSIVWTEEDFWNSTSGECQFRQLEGDFNAYEGVWKFTKNGEKTDLDLTLNYAIEIPLVGALMKSVIQKLMQGNCDMMTGALQKEAERMAA